MVWIQGFGLAWRIGNISMVVLSTDTEGNEICIVLLAVL